MTIRTRREGLAIMGSMDHRPRISDDPDGDLRDLVVAAAQGSDTTDGACERLVASMMERPELIRAHLPEILHYWARSKLDQIRRSTKTAVERRVAGSTERHGRQLFAAINAEYQRLMDMPLYGGKPIGKATVAEVRVSAGRYASQAGDMARKARWQIKVADAVQRTTNRADAKVAQSIDEATLKQLWSETGIVEAQVVPMVQRDRPPKLRVVDPSIRPSDRRQWLKGRRAL